MEKTSITSLLVFSVSLVIVILHIIPLLFPGLYFTLDTDSISNIAPFSQGIWFIPFLSINSVLLVFGILYYKKILPKKNSKLYCIYC